MYMHTFIYIYAKFRLPQHIFLKIIVFGEFISCIYIYIYIYRERERERHVVGLILRSTF